MYSYYHKHDGYSRRHEKRLRNADGTQAPKMLITRYTYKYTWRYNGVEGPKGGKARQQRAKYVFYYQGTFYRGKGVKLENGKSLNSYEVFDGVIFDAYAVSSKKQGVPVVTIELVEGIAVSVKDAEGVEIWNYFDNTISELEDMLKIPEQDRAVVETAEETETETETEATETETEDAEAQAFETARLNWIESTTTEGQQLDLIAWFGYGDATWQDLARPAA